MSCIVDLERVVVSHEVSTAGDAPARGVVLRTNLGTESHESHMTPGEALGLARELIEEARKCIDGGSIEP